MNIRLNGQLALVCGSTQGIGRAVAFELAALGARVILLARDGDRLASVLQELPASADGPHAILVADMADTHALEVALTAEALVGQVNILVNNTGGPPAGLAHEAAVDDYERAFRLHLLSHQTLVRAVVPGMMERGHGRIINVISTSVKQPLPNLGVSNTIRGAVANWSKTLATELGPFGITVNNVLPGATGTERLSALIRNKAAGGGEPEAAVAEAMMHEIPLRRFAQPEEIASAVAFLAGPSAAYINGVNLPVDGGRTASL
jgi:3-oxoacyl-[acyl-carrier protein] reductase